MPPEIPARTPVNKAARRPYKLGNRSVSSSCRRCRSRCELVCIPERALVLTVGEFTPRQRPTHSRCCRTLVAVTAPRDLQNARSLRARYASAYVRAKCCHGNGNKRKQFQTFGFLISPRFRQITRSNSRKKTQWKIARFHNGDVVFSNDIVIICSYRLQFATDVKCTIHQHFVIDIT